MTNPESHNPSRTLPENEFGFVVGSGEEPFLGGGWHDREIRRTDGTPYRAVDLSATFRLPLPPSGNPARLKVLLTAPVPFLEGPYRGELHMEGRRLGEILLESDNWALRRFDLPPEHKSGVARFTLRSDTFFVPSGKVEGSRDPRRIACYIGAVLLEPVESS